MHISGKSLFVRILRNTHHLTSNTKTHWAVWLSCTFGTGLLGFIIAEAVPFFTSLVSLIGSLGFSVSLLLSNIYYIYRLKPYIYSLWGYVFLPFFGLACVQITGRAP